MMNPRCVRCGQLLNLAEADMALNEPCTACKMSRSNEYAIITFAIFLA